MKKEMHLKIMYQLMQAVAKMHSLNIVHRDITPDNIVVDESINYSTLGDLGISVCLDNPDYREPINALIGTPGYIDPFLIKCVRQGA